MKSGGEIVFRPDLANAGRDRIVQESELQSALIDASGNRITTPPDNTTVVVWNGVRMTWGELKQQLTGRDVGRGGTVAGANINPQDSVNQRAIENLQQGQQLTGEIQQMKDLLSRNQFPVTFAGQTYNDRAAFEAATNQKVQQLAQLIAQIRADNQARGRGADEGITEAMRSTAGVESSSTGNGAGTGQFTARSMQMPGGQPAAGGAPQAGGARGFGMPGSGGYGDPLFAGMEPPTSAAYASALYMDSTISDGLGQLGASRREGQKMMMLFLYFARMAESGDPHAMYQFMKFITFIIAKDKARQNIHIGSKLIQLQDLSRKATETLMNADTTDPNKTQEFTKALHQAKSQEATISTSQKLLADMLQEFAGVTEGLISSTKNMQEFWMRASRRVTSQA